MSDLDRDCNLNVNNSDHVIAIEELLPFFIITNEELISFIMPDSNLYIKLCTRDARFDILSKNEYFNRITGSSGEGEILYEGDARNSTNCNFCDPIDLPSTPTNSTSVVLINFSISSHF